MERRSTATARRASASSTRAGTGAFTTSWAPLFPLPAPTSRPALYRPPTAGLSRRSRPPTPCPGCSSDPRLRGRQRRHRSFLTHGADPQDRGAVHPGRRRGLGDRGLTTHQLQIDLILRRRRQNVFARLPPPVGLPVLLLDSAVIVHPPWGLRRPYEWSDQNRNVRHER